MQTTTPHSPLKPSLFVTFPEETLVSFILWIKRQVPCNMLPYITDKALASCLVLIIDETSMFVY